MSSQFLAVSFLVVMTAIAVTSAWKSLASGKAQPASFLLRMKGKQPIVRNERSLAYWNHTIPWLLMTPITVVLTAWMIVAAATWPQCSDTVKEQCWYASNQ